MAVNEKKVRQLINLAPNFEIATKDTLISVLTRVVKENNTIYCSLEIDSEVKDIEEFKGKIIADKYLPSQICLITTNEELHSSEEVPVDKETIIVWVKSI